MLRYLRHRPPSRCGAWVRSLSRILMHHGHCKMFVKLLGNAGQLRWQLLQQQQQQVGQQQRAVCCHKIATTATRTSPKGRRGCRRGSRLCGFSYSCARHRQKQRQSSDLPSISAPDLPTSLAPSLPPHSRPVGCPWQLPLQLLMAVTVLKSKVGTGSQP